MLGRFSAKQLLTTKDTKNTKGRNFRAKNPKEKQISVKLGVLGGLGARKMTPARGEFF
jgi:hypothetical protein